MCYIDYPGNWPGTRPAVKYPGPPTFPWAPTQTITNPGDKPLTVEIGGAKITLAPGQSVQINGSGTLK